MDILSALNIELYMLGRKLNTLFFSLMNSNAQIVPRLKLALLV